MYKKITQPRAEQEYEIPEENIPVAESEEKVLAPLGSFPNPEVLRYYRDKDDRLFWLIGEVDEDVYEITSQILEFNKEDMGVPREERQPIRIIIDSIGGSLTKAFMLIDMITLSETPIIGYAIGECCSAASMIFLACHKRFALPNTFFLFHKGSCDNIGGTFDQVNAFMNYYEKQINILIDFYSKHTNYSLAVIKEKLNGGNDWYLFTQEASEWGVVDEIVSSIDQILIPKLY